MVLVPSSALWDSPPPVWRCWRHGLDALWINWLWGAKGVVRPCCYDIMRHLENQRCWIFLEWPDDVCSLLSSVSLISGLLLIQKIWRDPCFFLFAPSEGFMVEIWDDWRRGCSWGEIRPKDNVCARRWHPSATGASGTDAAPAVRLLADDLPGLSRAARLYQRL